MYLAALLLPLAFVQTAGKLEIKDTKVGTGQKVQAGDRVTVDYTGKLTNGKQFDTSIGKGPFSFIVGAGMVIEGWDQGLLGMKTGGTRTLSIPPAMGYGAVANREIPANSTLNFTIDLKKIERIPVKITKKGKGTPVKGGDTVLMHYSGSLKDGKKFDSSYDRNEPFEITVGRTGLIPGFTMGVVGMLPGEKRTITISPELGYGSRGAGDVIPPNATLVFELEILKVVK